MIAGTAGPDLFAAPGAAACSACGRRTCVDSAASGRSISRPRHSGRISRRRGARHLRDRRPTILARTPGGGAPPIGATVGLPGRFGCARLRHRERARRAVDAAPESASPRSSYNHTSGEHLRMNNFTRIAIAASAGGRVTGGIGRSATEITVLLSGRCRRPDHQDHRRLCRRIHQGESRHHREADLYRQLSGLGGQGDDRGQGRQCAGRRGAAVHRHVHADR